jgi:hypothetical protein
MHIYQKKKKKRVVEIEIRKIGGGRFHGWEREVLWEGRFRQLYTLIVYFLLLMGRKLIFLFYMHGETTLFDFMS